MTYGKLKQIFEENEIPLDTVLMSDSGWECDATHMDGIYYSDKEKVAIFTQSRGFDSFDKKEVPRNWYRDEATYKRLYLYDSIKKEELW